MPTLSGFSASRERTHSGVTPEGRYKIADAGIMKSGKHRIFCTFYAEISDLCDNVCSVFEKIRPIITFFWRDFVRALIAYNKLEEITVISNSLKKVYLLMLSSTSGCNCSSVCN